MFAVRRATLSFATASRLSSVRFSSSLVLDPELNPRNYKDGEAHYPVKNPATGETITHVADMSLAQTRAAIEQAHETQAKWGKTTVRERNALLRKWAALIHDNSAYLASLITAEGGKPKTEAVGEVTYGASFVTWFAEQCLRASGDVMQPMVAHQRIVMLRQPVGVTVGITPWNFPMGMIARKAGAALGAGCTMVIKPAEDTPLTAQAMIQLAIRAGIPEGVMPLVTCSRDSITDIGKELVTHPHVRKVSFTGSTAVGKHLYSLASGTVKKVSLELGGNAPFIVFDDANIDAAVVGAMASKFRNSGQTCVCANRFFVHEKVHDEFVAKLKAHMEKLVVGNGAHAGVNQGPLINKRAVDKVDHLVKDAKKRGAQVLLGGERIKSNGSFYAPTLLTNITEDMDIHQQEIFGPVACVSTFTSEADVIKRANATRAGLVGYFYAKDLGRVWRVAEALEYGMVGVNSGLLSTEVAPFGGIKESGIGREGSVYGMDDYLEWKYVLMDISHNH